MREDPVGQRRLIPAPVLDVANPKVENDQGSSEKQEREDRARKGRQHPF